MADLQGAVVVACWKEEWSMSMPTEYTALATGTTVELDAFDAEMTEQLRHLRSIGFAADAYNLRRMDRSRWEYDLRYPGGGLPKFDEYPGLTIYWLYLDFEGTTHLLIARGGQLLVDREWPLDGMIEDDNSWEHVAIEAGWPADEAPWIFTAVNNPGLFLEHPNTESPGGRFATQ
jgi:hypothetical protein